MLRAGPLGRRARVQQRRTFTGGIDVHSVSCCRRGTRSGHAVHRAGRPGAGVSDQGRTAGRDLRAGRCAGYHRATPRAGDVEAPRPERRRREQAGSRYGDRLRSRRATIPRRRSHCRGCDCPRACEPAGRRDGSPVRPAEGSRPGGRSHRFAPCAGLEHAVPMEDAPRARRRREGQSRKTELRRGQLAHENDDRWPCPRSRHPGRPGPVHGRRPMEHGAGPGHGRIRIHRRRRRRGPGTQAARAGRDGQRAQQALSVHTDLRRTRPASLQRPGDVPECACRNPRSRSSTG